MGIAITPPVPDEVDVAGDTMTGNLSILPTGGTGTGLTVRTTERQAITGMVVPTGWEPGGGSSIGHYAISAVCAETEGEVGALNVSSSNPEASALNVRGVETGRGTVKITHDGDGASDTNGAALSIDLTTAEGAALGTKARGIFLTSTTSDATGDAILVRRNSRDEFVVKQDGKVGIGLAATATPGGALEVRANDDSTPSISVRANSTGAGNLLEFKRSSDGAVRTRISPTCQLVTSENAYLAGAGVQIGSTSGEFGSGTGVLGIRNASVVPSTNPTNGAILYVEGGVLKVRDSVGNVHQVVERNAAAANGLLAWSFDPAAAVNNSVLTAGVLYLTKVVLAAPATITNLLAFVVTQGNSLTSGQNFAALFDSSGTQRGITADQTTAWGSNGAKTMALTSPYAAAAGSYWVALLANGSTAPAFARSAGTAVGNIGLAAASYRFGTSGTGQTAVPASVTMGSMGSSAVALWVGVS